MSNMSDTSLVLVMGDDGGLTDSLLWLYHRAGMQATICYLEECGRQVHLEMFN